jgi:hypothetical protein
VSLGKPLTTTAFGVDLSQATGPTSVPAVLRMRALTFEPWRGRFERPCKGSFAPAPQSFFACQMPFVGAGESTHAFSVLAAPIALGK